MNKCNRCRKEKDIKFFLKNNKELKTCVDCRENSCKSKDNWYKNNKEVVSLYNKIRIDKKYDNTEQCGGICINGFISSRRIIKMYVDHILELFNDEEYLNKQIEKCSTNSNFAFTEMAAYNHFKNYYNLKTIRLNAFISNDTFDDCLACKDDMQQTDEVYNGHKIKEIFINRNYNLFFKHSSDNRFYKINSVNFSWIPSFIISRIFFTYCRSLFPALRIINFKKEYIKVDFNNYSFFNKFIDRLLFAYLRFRLSLRLLRY